MNGCLRYVTLALPSHYPTLTLPSHYPTLPYPTLTLALHHPQNGSFMLYWLVLGILSSVGLGAGLHTFVLYLGPHIIRVTSTAATCGSANFSAQIEQYVSWIPEYTADAFTCPPDADPDSDVAIMDIVAKVAPACFFWGLGTAIGELPPYFVARAARWSSGEEAADDELAAVLASETSATAGEHLGAMERAKLSVFRAVHKYGFFAILLAASIPNPLFDVAGLTCGHIGISFWTFFLATAVGKACIKAMLQAVFYVVLFSPAAMEAVRSTINAAAAAMNHAINSVRDLCSLPIDLAHLRTH